MAGEYKIKSFDGEIEVDPETRNITATSLDLVGKQYSGWGEATAQNFVNLLQNFAAGSAPLRARTGQLWYDTTEKTLKVYNKTTSEWKDIAGDGSNWAEARKITLVGDATGNVMLDGSADVTLTVALATKLSGTVDGVNKPGFYSSPAITVDAQGRIVSISNNGSSGSGPTTYVESISFGSGTPVGGPVQVTAANIVAALGYTPYDAANPANYSPATTPQDLSSFLLLNGTRPMTGALNLSNNTINNVATPTASGQATNKSYVDAAVGAKVARNFNGAASTSYNVTVSPNAPSGGSNGDIWYRY